MLFSQANAVPGELDGQAEDAETKSSPEKGSVIKLVGDRFVVLQSACPTMRNLKLAVCRFVPDSKLDRKSSPAPGSPGAFSARDAVDVSAQMSGMSGKTST